MGPPTAGRLGPAGRGWGRRRENDMGGSIMCGVDGSADSHAALDVAARLAERLEARLGPVHVAELERAPLAAVARVGMTGIAPRAMALATRDEQEEAGAQLLEQVAAEHGLADAEQLVVVGFPAERLADLADVAGAELIVVGSRGRGRFKAAFLGSGPSSLVGGAPCPGRLAPP